jgi:hypothetical protein
MFMSSVRAHAMLQTRKAIQLTLHAAHQSATNRAKYVRSGSGLQYFYQRLTQ